MRASHVGVIALMASGVIVLGESRVWAQTSTQAAGDESAPVITRALGLSQASDAGWTSVALVRALTAAFSTPQQSAPQPPSNPGAPTLGDLGIPPDETRANPEEQARLNRQSHMLKVHQRLGLITTIPLVATVFSGSFAGGRSTSSTARDVHAALGSLTAGLYVTTASYAIFAPKIPGTKTRGPIRLHKTLAWIHGPGMVLTPILGGMAFDERSRGERVHGIASLHGVVGSVTAIAYGLAIASVSVRF